MSRKIYKKKGIDGYMLFYMCKDGKYYRKVNLDSFSKGYMFGEWEEIDEETFKRCIKNAELVDE